MVNVREIPGDVMVEELTTEFSSMENIKVPEWTLFQKAGMHREKSWSQEDWYYRRLASTLRKVYSKGNIGIEKLSTEYGGKKDGGSKPYHPARGSRAIIRHMFNELQELGLVEKGEKGRRVTAKGQAMLDRAAKKAMDKIVEKNPELKKYQ
ncbi:MAG: 30S ribosomal protein S19e [Candidatus Thermoplasmatota archaeon]|jgi:small subunit ribosomal protein S19e|nr:30S ribosomal protein S19e [Candidatus Thermoplasmatota archaeon]